MSNNPFEKGDLGSEFSDVNSEKEKTSTEQVQDLALEYSKLKQESANLFQFNNMMALEGGRELLTICGPERFFTALDSVRNQVSEKEFDPAENISLHAVIRELEPDAGQREALYRQILESAEENIQKTEEEIATTNSIEESLSQSHANRGMGFGYNQNNLTWLKSYLKDYQMLDRIETSPYPKQFIGRILRMIQGREQTPQSMGLYLNPGGEVESFLRAQLSDERRNITPLLNQLDDELDNDKIELDKQAEQFIEPLKNSIQEIESNLRLAAKSRIQRLLDDSSKLGEINPESDQASELFEQVVGLLEAEVENIEKETEVKVKQDTAELQIALNQIQDYTNRRRSA